MKNRIVKIGEIVKYNGYRNYQSRFQKDIMHRFLEIGCCYIVKSVCIDYGYVKGNNYYTFEEFNKNHNYLYPCKSFDIVSREDYIKNKYNLK